MIASPLSTTFGGTCCSPSALRSRLSTTTIFVNDVTITATNGASARLTTVTMMSAGLKLLKSMRIDRDHLHAERVAHGDQLAVTDAHAIRADHDARFFEPRCELQDEAGLHRGDLAER